MQGQKKKSGTVSHQNAFTLLEVLISIVLLGIVIVALFSVVTMMRDSNEHLYAYLEKAKKITQGSKMLYLDILGSDGNITIVKDEYSRLCMEETRNSLYGLSLAKVCWIVLKDNNTLARSEGNDYELPLRFEDKAEVDLVMSEIEHFDVYHEKDKVLVLLKEKGKEPITFMVQGITRPQPQVSKKQEPPKNTNQRTQIPPKVDANSTRPPIIR